MRPARTARMIPVLIVVLCITNIVLANEPPVADAGLPRYAATDPVQLDGSGSYDPDQSGSLSYTWTQVSGQSVVIADANTAKPTISGFVQTNEIQECEFELVVSDGELTSPPDRVKVTIVPDFGVSRFVLENPPFDADRPTIIYFGGGDCTNGLAVDGWSPFTPSWLSRANIIYFPNGYTPDSGGGARTYYKYGDMIIAYLSAVAPDYRQPIQTTGWSTGGQPAVDVGIHLNLIYADARYAINRVTFFDAIRYCRGHYRESISTYLGSSVDGEQCWADAYVSATSGAEGYVAGPSFQENVLNVGFPSATGGWYQRHIVASGWYANSLELAEMNHFNHGAVAGAYWSVVGPGKNLQLASTPGAQTYRFEWYGDASSGYMDFYDETNHPGRLPEPVTLVGPVDVGDPNGAVLTCAESENALRYQLLFGSDPYRVMDYSVVSDTSVPPNEVITALPFDETWWTVRVSDQYGSTIHADPLRIDHHVLSVPIENVTLGTRYGYLQMAIDEALDGHEIVIGQGTCHENIDLRGKSLTLRSVDPDDATVVAATVIAGARGAPTVTSLADDGKTFVLNGFTITGGTAGVSCRNLSPTIRNCTIGSDTSVAIEFWCDYEPNIVDSSILGSVAEIDDPRLIAYWRLDESEGTVAHDSVGEHDATVMGVPLWQPEGGMVDGALQFSGMPNFAMAEAVRDPSEGPLSVLAWVKDGAPGQVIVSQQAGANWLMADPATGALTTELKSGGRLGKALSSDVIVTDGDWHRIGFTWDGSNRRLYVDDALAAEDTHDGLAGSSGKILIGCGMIPGTFFTGLIDDVRIYNRAVEP